MRFRPGQGYAVLCDDFTVRQHQLRRNVRHIRKNGHVCIAAGRNRAHPVVNAKMFGHIQRGHSDGVNRRKPAVNRFLHDMLHIAVCREFSGGEAV